MKPSLKLKPRPSPRIEELKTRVYDESYLNNAIINLATQLSEEIMDGLGVSNGSWKR
jgi:hypothetical protein